MAQKGITLTYSGYENKKISVRIQDLSFQETIADLEETVRIEFNVGYADELQAKIRHTSFGSGMPCN